MTILAFSADAAARGLADTRAAADLLADTNASAQQRLTALLTTWRGASADAFAEAFAQWQRAAGECRAGLDAIAGGLVSAEAMLHDTDHARAGAVAALADRLGG